jgi:type I restriction enzyme S subunit
MGVIENLYLAVPPLAEQEAIAAFLGQETGKIDALVEEQRRLIELLKEKRQAVISHAVTKGLNPSVPMKDSGADWLGPVPEHWRVERAGHLFVERDERSEDGDEEMLTVSHLTGVTPRSEKTVNMFEAETNEGYKKVAQGDLVINTLWAWMGAMGVSSNNGIVSPAYHVYSPRPSIQSDYINNLVRIPNFAREASRWSKGVWSSRLRLYPQEMFQILFPVPPAEEQLQISKRILGYELKADRLIRESERAIDLLQERRTALISAAVTGKIDVRGLAAEDAA